MAFAIFLAALFQALLVTIVVEAGVLSRELKDSTRRRWPRFTISQPARATPSKASSQAAGSAPA